MEDMEGIVQKLGEMTPEWWILLGISITLLVISFKLSDILYELRKGNKR